MLCQALRAAVIMFSLPHFIAPALDLMGYLPSRQRREAIKAFHPRREQRSATKIITPFLAIQNSKFSIQTSEPMFECRSEADVCRGKSFLGCRRIGMFIHSRKQLDRFGD